MQAVIGWLITLLPIIWAFATKALPRLVPAILSTAGRAGIIGTICALIAKIYTWCVNVPVFIGSIFRGVGVLGGIFVFIRYVLSLMLRFPVIVGITLVTGQYFPTLIEKIFLVVGAVSIKIALIFVRWGKHFIDNLSVNNTEELNEVLGQTVDSLPPCIVDVMGYLHFVEDIGMILTTATFIGIYNLVTYFFMKYR